MISQIFKYCKEYKLSISVLGRQIGEEKSLIEKNYFKKFNSTIKFYNRTEDRDNFKILDRYNYIFTIDSTLGIEALSRGCKVGFIFNRPYKHPYKSRSLGYMEKLKKNGPFWTSEQNEKEFYRVFKFVIKTKDKNWKKIRNKIISNIMPFDEGNRTFKKILYKELK